MKASSLAAVALVAIGFAGVAQAGPKSPLYLTDIYIQGHNRQDSGVVQGNGVINSFPEAYGAPNEIPIAVWGDVRTTGWSTFVSAFYPTGGQYTLGGTPTGTSYVLPGVGNEAFDSTSDGSHNYLVDLATGTVYQTARDYTNPVALFTAGGANPLGITYDRANNSLWISGWFADTNVTDYSLSGGFISSFSTGHGYNGALALDPADQTLWLVNDVGSSGNFGYLEQYSQSGALLSVGPYVGFTLGGEFNLGPAATPEPGTLIMFGSGVLGLAGILRRKINL